MKKKLVYVKQAIAFLLCISDLHAYAQDFKEGIPASGFSAVAGYQSAALSWSPAVFPSGGYKAGYLLMYSTSAPALVSSPDGLSPEYTVFNGTIVSTASVRLPDQPSAHAVASGLADGTTYNFMIVAYIWDGTNTSSYEYSKAVTICVPIPPDGPEHLDLPNDSITSACISGSFSKPLFEPAGYAVLYSTSAEAPVLTNGRTYKEGEVLGEYTIAQVGGATSFSSLHSGRNLAPSTTYYIYVLAYAVSACDQMPVYSAVYATDSATTLAADVASFFMFDHFEVAKAKGYNELTWKAACRQPLSGFVAQASVDSERFIDMDTVSAPSALGCAMAFNYDDYKNMAADKIYYRIKAVDGNNNVFYSRVLKISNAKKDAQTMRLEHNPVYGNAVLQVTSPIDDNFELAVLCIDGRALERKKVKVQSGAATVSLNTASFTKGMYVVVALFGSGERSVLRFIKQ